MQIIFSKRNEISMKKGKIIPSGKQFQNSLKRRKFQ